MAKTDLRFIYAWILCRTGMSNFIQNGQVLVLVLFEIGCNCLLVWKLDVYVNLADLSMLWVDSTG